MDFIALFSQLEKIIQVAQMALTLGEDAAPFVATILDLIHGKGTLSIADRAALLAKEEALRAQLQAPLSAS